MAIALPGAGAGGAHLEVVNHTSLYEEKVTKHGQTYDAHVVVKNSPFVITLALRDCRTHDFNHLAFDVGLLYDMPNYDKYVPFVTTKPLEFKSSIGGERGEEISFDVKIKVLSSHHEDNFFRLHFQVWDPMEKSTFKPLSIVSAAVKVISKPLKPKTPKPKATPVAKPKPAKRKAADMDEEEEEEDDEMVLEQMPSALESTLELVARQQRETLEILHRLASNPLATSPTLTASGSLPSLPTPPPAKRPRLDMQAIPDDFEGAFSTMLHSYAQLSSEQKAEKVRRLVRGLPTRDAEMLEELFDVLATQGVRVQAGLTFQHQHTEACAEDCPHREELQRVEDFFNEVFY